MIIDENQLLPFQNILSTTKLKKKKRKQQWKLPRRKSGLRLLSQQDYWTGKAAWKGDKERQIYSDQMS